MRLLSKISAACIFLLGMGLNAHGQEGRSMRDFEYIRLSAPWLSSSNAAGLAAMPVDRASIAEGALTKDNGGLKDDASSEDSFGAGIQTESYLRINARLTFYGKLSYTYDSGKNMGGSILMDPTYNPINFYESVDTTGGVKNKELYHLLGGISYALKDSRWTIGAKIDYESGDQAKLKDPRFLNVWMDLGTSIGTRFAASEGFSVGLNLEYRRTLETTSSKTYGISGKQYYSFVDYGGYIGSREILDGEYSMMSIGNSRPMLNNFMGGSLQIEFGRKIKIFNELTYLLRTGYYGSRGSSSITYTEHAGNVIRYKGRLIAGNLKNKHHVGLDLSYETLINNENVFRMSTEVGENTVVEYISQNEVLDRSDISAVISYTGYLDVENFRPRWEYGVNAAFSSRQSLATIYPYYRSSGHSSISADIYGKRNFLSGKNLFTVGLGLDFMTGFGVPKEDGFLANSSSEAPKSFDNYLYRDFEFKTASRAGGYANVRYTRLISDNIGVYAQISERYTSLLQAAEYLSNGHRNTLAITIGCTF